MTKYIFPNGDTLEMKAIKRAAFQSEETHCYEAKLYLNGKPFAIVSNDGHGGADYQYPAGDHTNADITAIDERCKNEMPKYVSSFAPEGMSVDLELWCALGVDDWLMRKDMKTSMKSKVLVSDPKRPGSVFEIKFKGCRKITDRQLFVIASEKPDYKILNRMSEDDAFAIYKAAANT